MLTFPIKTLMRGGKAAVLSTVLAGVALAQADVVSTPQGNDVLVPDRAVDAEHSKGLEWANGLPVLEEVENNDAIIQTMIAQGFTDLKITRKGPTLTITGQREGVPTELVYSTDNGQLKSVDGVETVDREPSIADRAMDNVPENAGHGGFSEPLDDPHTAGHDPIGTGTDAGLDVGHDASESATN